MFPKSGIKNRGRNRPYKKFRVVQDKLYKSDFDKLVEKAKLKNKSIEEKQ